MGIREAVLELRMRWHALLFTLCNLIDWHDGEVAQARAFYALVRQRQVGSAGV